MPSPRIDETAIARNLLRAADQTRKQGQRQPYYAVVDTVSGELVAVHSVSATTAGTELIARTTGIATVGELGICTPVDDGSWIFVRLAASADKGGPGATVDLTAAAKDSTTNTATAITRLTTTVTPPSYGAWGCEVSASGVLWRSVATGEARLKLNVGGTSHEVIASAADGLTLTQAITLNARILRTAASPMTFNAGNPSVTISLEYRGGSTAGTTNIVDAEIRGSLYRIS